MSLEILKHRHVGQFMDKTQYLRRKVVIPLELPKQVRGTNIILNNKLISNCSIFITIDKKNFRSNFN